MTMIIISDIVVMLAPQMGPIRHSSNGTADAQRIPLNRLFSQSGVY